VPDPRGLSRPPQLRIVVVALLLTFSCATLIGSVVPARDGLHRTQDRLDRQRDENERLTLRLEELTDEEDALRTQPRLTKRILRGFGITDPDEIRVRMGPSTPTPELLASPLPRRK
jgi:hypothetical protein